MGLLAEASGTSLDDPWATFAADSAEGRLCAERGAALRRTPVEATPDLPVPTSLGHPHRKAGSTQAALGRLLADLVRDAPEAAARLVTCSPDVASSTNLGGWINKTGVWAVRKLDRVEDVAQALGHLLALLVADEGMDVDVAEGDLAD